MHGRAAGTIPLLMTHSGHRANAAGAAI